MGSIYLLLAVGFGSLCGVAGSSGNAAPRRVLLREYRVAERQRTVAFLHHPGGGRYFSSQLFFENMDAMENGTAPPPIAQSKGDGFTDSVKHKRFNSRAQIPIDYSEILEENTSHEHDLMKTAGWWSLLGWANLEGNFFATMAMISLSKFNLL
ncbi:hypothetical protein SASPL_123022 [Salvia splendens]|uniref:Uncharacterized protein n=1 Tax=Salvia splendens TaxID=180675 RepID=A0A8X8XMF5_SALSN|nr:hypothetical protein SASPL_123022 [Salvia splendens]